MTPYFGSDGSQMGVVHSLPVTTFAQFVKEQLGHPALLNVTRDQYHALSKADRNALKRVPYFVPAAFAASPVSRKVENAVHCNLIAIDIDDENPAMASVYSRTPAALAAALQPYAYAAYTTASSLPSTPRLRIIVAADKITPARYAEAVNTVAKLLGLVSLTSESLVCVQPMYLPTSFAGDDVLGDHPLIASDTAGRAFAEADIGEPGAVPTQSPAKGKPDESGPTLDDLDFLSTTLPEVTTEDMESALAALDPDMPYMEWLEVAAALRHQFPHDTDAAFDLFDKWSAKGKKYAGEKDTAAKWLSLRPTPRGRKPVTARTILFRAAQAGWSRAAQVSERLYQAIKTWIEAEERTPAELMKEAPRRIAGSPLMAPLEKATLLTTLQKRLKDHGLKVSPNDIKREMRRFSNLVFAAPEVVKPTPDSQLPPWARGMCYVAATNEFFIRQGDRRYEPGACNNMFNVHLMPPGASESGRPPVQATDFLLNVVRIPRVDQYRYDPAHSEQTFFTENGARFVNTYRPTYPEACYDGMEEVGEIVSQHVHRLLGHKDYAETLIDWMAFIVQNPGRKIRWAPLVQGVFGCGKTLVAKIMEAAIGKGNVKFIDANLLFEKYNDWAGGAQLVVLEEVRVVGHNRHEVMNKLKPAIGNDDVTIREMYEKAVPSRNCTNYLLLTNHQDALAITPDDRRYFVLHSAMQTREQVMALPDGYFATLFALVEQKAPQLRAWLLSHQIRPEFSADGHAPRTRYLHDMAQASQSPLAAAVREAVAESPNPLVTANVVSMKALADILSIEGVRDANGQAVAAVMRDAGFRAAGRCRLADGRHSFWVRRGTPADAKPDIAVQRILDDHPELLQDGGMKELKPKLETNE